MLPESVQQLLREHLPSFECLELLLFLHSRGGEPANVEELSKQTGVSRDLVGPAIQSLEASHLVRRSTTEPPTFRFAAATAAAESAVAELASLYRTQRAAVMSEMSINAIGRIRSGSLRAFADAFVLGNKNKRGSDG